MRPALRAPLAGIYLALLALASGCATLKDQARLKRRAESIVWGALAAPAPALRLRAARVAADVADPLLDRGLAARLGDPSPAVRATAAAALVRATPLAVEVLRAALDGTDAEARTLAIDGLDALPEAAPRLGRLAGDGDVRVRARAAAALGTLHPPGARALLSSLAHDRDAGVRGQALYALGALADRGALGDVVAALSDPSLGVRLAALSALVRLARAELSARLTALAVGPDRYLALRATVQLERARNGAPAAALATVRAAAEAADPALRAAAMNAAGELGAAGRALALAHLADGDLDVRLAAARAAIAVGAVEPARAPLVAALDGPRALDAAEELARIGDARGLDRLRIAATAADPSLRREAVARLALLAAGRDRVIAALDDPDADIRLDAAATLLRRLFR